MNILSPLKTFKFLESIRCWYSNQADLNHDCNAVIRLQIRVCHTEKLFFDVFFKPDAVNQILTIYRQLTRQGSLDRHPYRHIGYSTTMSDFNLLRACSDFCRICGWSKMNQNQTKNIKSHVYASYPKFSKVASIQAQKCDFHSPLTCITSRVHFLNCRCTFCIKLCTL